MKQDSYTWPEVTKTEAQWKLADVKVCRVSMEEFLKQADDFELVVLLVGANVTDFSAVETPTVL